MKRSALACLTLLSATLCCQGEVLFHGKWSPVRGKFTSMWGGLQVVSPDRFRLDRDATNGTGSVVARIEVRPGDKPAGLGGERAEVLDMHDNRDRSLPVTTLSGHEFYGISVKLDSNWKPPRSASGGSEWGTFFQLHGPDSLRASPSLALMAMADFHLDLSAGDLLDGGKRAKVRGAVSLPFSDGSLNLGRWNQFLLDIVWASDETGSVVVYRRNQGQNEWVKVLEKQHTPTLQFTVGQPVGNHYWKAGFYRCESPTTSVLWLGPIARGTNKDEVIKAAFGK